jgi:predicted site-specific integrase-resolvase
MRMQDRFNPPIDYLYSLQELSELSGISVPALRVLVYAGEIPCIQGHFRGKVRIRISEFNKYIEKHSGPWKKPE